MPLIFAFDFETTGLDPKTDKVIEVGAVLYDWNRRRPLKILSELIADRQIPPEITALTGITQSDIDKYGIDGAQVMESFAEMAKQANYFCAHNAPFDLGFLPFDLYETMKPRTIDTCVDLPIDRNIHKSNNLTTLAATHEFLNPFPHRAVFDVLTMLKIASKYDLADILKRQKSPMITLVSLTTYEENHFPKSAGFKFDGTEKVWKKRIKQFELENLNFKFKFRVER